MSEIADTDLAYLAGLLDAIGRVRLVEIAGGSKLAYVGISSTHMDLLERAATMTGVRVTKVVRDYDRLGCGEHCTEPHLHVESRSGRWSLTGARAAVVLTAVRPFLTTLGPEADAVLEAADSAPEKPATRRKMAQLGWPAA